jgi:hypothetical protein
MKKSFNYLAISSCFILVTTLAHADADSSQGTQMLDGSGSTSNKMDDSGKDPKGKERPQRDNVNPMNQSSAGNMSADSCCWSPDSSTKRSGKNMGDAQNKNMNYDDDDDDDDDD